MAAAPTSRKRSRFTELQLQSFHPLQRAVILNDPAEVRRRLDELFIPQNFTTEAAAIAAIDEFQQALRYAMAHNLVRILEILDTFEVPHHRLPPEYINSIHETVAGFRSQDLIDALDAEDYALLRLIFARENSNGLIARDFERPFDFFIKHVRTLEMAVFIFDFIGELISTDSGLQTLLRNVIPKSVPSNPKSPVSPETLHYILNHSLAGWRAYHAAEGESKEDIKEHVDLIADTFENMLFQEGRRSSWAHLPNSAQYYLAVMTSSLWIELGLSQPAVHTRLLSTMMNDPGVDQLTDDMVRRLGTVMVERFGADWSQDIEDEATMLETLRKAPVVFNKVLALTLTVPYIAEQFADADTVPGALPGQLVTIATTIPGARFLAFAELLAARPYIPSATSLVAAAEAFPGNVFFGSKFPQDQFDPQRRDNQNKLRQLSDLYRRVALLLHDAAAYWVPPRTLIIKSAPVRKHLRDVAQQLLARVKAAEPQLEAMIAQGLQFSGLPAELVQLAASMRYERLEPQGQQRRPSRGMTFAF